MHTSATRGLEMKDVKYEGMLYEGMLLVRVTVGYFRSIFPYISFFYSATYDTYGDCTGFVIYCIPEDPHNVMTCLKLYYYGSVLIIRSPDFKHQRLADYERLLGTMNIREKRSMRIMRYALKKYVFPEIISRYSRYKRHQDLANTIVQMQTSKKSWSQTIESIP